LRLCVGGEAAIVAPVRGTCTLLRCSSAYCCACCDSRLTKTGRDLDLFPLVAAQEQRSAVLSPRVTACPSAAVLAAGPLCLCLCLCLVCTATRTGHTGAAELSGKHGAGHRAPKEAQRSPRNNPAARA
jgi:hypothetical protein